MKWFNARKGYGYVELADGSGEAFLPATVLERADIIGIQRGDMLEVRVASSRRGPRVIEVTGVGSATTAQVGFDGAAPGAGHRETGVVKWYSPAKGFGFIVRDSGGEDIFVHTSALQRAGSRAWPRGSA